MTPEERQQMFDYASLGREVDSFWSSGVGKYLLKRSDDEYIKAMEAIKTADPTDVKTIVRLQGEIWRAESFRLWLSEAIKTGLVAEANLEERGEDEAP